MARPSWLGRAVGNEHHHAIEQASRRWRGGRRDDSAGTRRKILISTQVPCSDTEALVAALEKLDAPVRFTKLTDEETPESPPYVAYMEHHNAWTPAYKVDSPMWAWLFAQSREEGA